MRKGYFQSTCIFCGRTGFLIFFNLKLNFVLVNVGVEEEVNFKSRIYLASALGAMFLAACGGGNGSSGSNSPTPVADTTPPSLSFSPASFTIVSGTTGTSTLTASDNIGVTIGPDVTCTGEGSFSGSTFSYGLGFTAGGTRTSVCTATASDAAGNTSEAILTVMITEAVEVTYSYETVRDKSVVSEGQPFTLDSSGSSASNGETLVFNYRQTAGTPVTIADPSNPIQNLTAPEVSTDETLTFEVTISSETGGSSQGPISIIVENFNPVETKSDSSSFNGGDRVNKIMGIIANDDEGYTVHWESNILGSPVPTSSQNFTADGERINSQTNGEFQATGNQISGSVKDVIESGDTLYYVNHYIDAADMLGMTTHRGLVTGTAFSFGNEFQSPVNRSFPANTTIPFGTNRILSIVTGGSIAGTSDFVSTYIIQPDGTSTETVVKAAGNNVNVLDGTVATFGDNNFVAIWSEENSDGSGFGIKMQRIASGGTLLSGPITVNSKTEFDQLLPHAAKMIDGNVFVVWSDTGDAQGEKSIKGRLIQPNGTFATDEFTIAAPTARLGGPTRPFVTALKTNQVLVSWSIGIPTAFELEAQAFNADGTTASNVFSIQSSDPNASDESAKDLASFESVTLEDNRVILGWSNQAPSDTSHVVGFYPVGKQ